MAGRVKLLEKDENTNLFIDDDDGDNNIYNI